MLFMTAVITKPDTEEKLRILASDAQYDLACACGTRTPEEHRKRSEDGRWIYPVTLPNGGTSVLFKTLLSNVCTNDCKYCPLRDNQDLRRCTLSTEETCQTFLEYLNQKKVFGLFLSSGVIGTPDRTMDRLNSIAETLRRKYQFRGYIHLKIIPGSSTAAIEKAVSLATAVSLNIETPGAEYLSKLSSQKDFLRDIVDPIKLISRLRAKGGRYGRVKQTTQFIVGAADEPDEKIVRYMQGLYKRLHLQRVYFSAYQQGLGAADLPAEQKLTNPADMLTREHRLYQVDFLMRKYGFEDSDIEFDPQGRLSLEKDPKELWAGRHPDFFPVNINQASRWELLRVPGLGPITVNRILNSRIQSRIHRVEEIGKPGRLLRKAAGYICF
jgi:predicted DNA-binding helix-hairpin-helix protein